MILRNQPSLRQMLITSHSPGGKKIDEHLPMIELKFPTWSNLIQQSFDLRTFTWKDPWPFARQRIATMGFLHCHWPRELRNRSNVGMAGEMTNSLECWFPHTMPHDMNYTMAREHGHKTGLEVLTCKHTQIYIYYIYIMYIFFGPSLAQVLQGRGSTEPPLSKAHVSLFAFTDVMLSVSHPLACSWQRTTGTAVLRRCCPPRTKPVSSSSYFTRSSWLTGAENCSRSFKILTAFRVRFSCPFGEVSKSNLENCS